MLFPKICVIGAAVCVLAGCQGEKYDVVIRGGKVVDGTGKAAYDADVAVKDGRIAAVGKLGWFSRAERKIDARGKFVAPGFIDVHTHCENVFLSRPEAENFVRMGVTSIVTGNCGNSYRNLASAFAQHEKKGMGVNMALLIGHNTVRAQVMGVADRDPSTTEISAMCALVEKAMVDGAIGLSSGLVYAPGKFAKSPELVALAKTAANYGGIYTTHMRDEALKVMDALDEAISVARQANIPLEISHLKIMSYRLHGKAPEALQRIEEARRSGVNVTEDMYLYTASSTDINSMLPDWVSPGLGGNLKACLSDPTSRSLIIQDIIARKRDESGLPDLSYARIALFPADKSLNGLNLKEVASKLKASTSWQAQAETVLDIVTSGGADMVFQGIDEKDIEVFAKDTYTMVASDSTILVPGNDVPHPRGYGNNARMLACYVREKKLLGLEEAVRKMTSLPARTFRFSDRGVIAKGMAADLVVFDLAQVKDCATFERPHAYAEGFSYVLVNGTPVIDDGKLTNKYPGKILRYLAKAQEQ